MRHWLIRTILLTLLTAVAAIPQEPPAPKAEGESFVSGVVTELSADKIVVDRIKPAEKRTFIRNADTKVEGKLKVKSRVTLRFATSDEGDIALSILVRDGK